MTDRPDNHVTGDTLQTVRAAIRTAWDEIRAIDGPAADPGSDYFTASFLANLRSRGATVVDSEEADGWRKFYKSINEASLSVARPAVEWTIDKAPPSVMAAAREALHIMRSEIERWGSDSVPSVLALAAMELVKVDHVLNPAEGCTDDDDVPFDVG